MPRLRESGTHDLASIALRILSVCPVCSSPAWSVPLTRRRDVSAPAAPYSPAP